MTDARAPAVLTWLAGGIGELAGLVWPARCAGCGRSGTGCCPACRATLHTGVRVVAVPGWPDGPGVHVAARYAGVPAQLVVAWKERGRHDLTAAFASALAPVLVAAAEDAAAWLPPAGTGPPLLVPVPTSRANRRRRGGDLVRDLADRSAAAAARLGPGTGQVPEAAPGLRHARRVRDQAGLDAIERRRNLAGALSVRRSTAKHVPGRDVVLLDDVVTTGATLAEAARALTSAGARVVGACCLCVTSRRQGVSGRPSLV